MAALFAEVGRRLVREGGPLGMVLTAVAARGAVVAAQRMEQAREYGRCLGLDDEQIDAVIADEARRLKTRPEAVDPELVEAALLRHGPPGRKQR